MVGDLVSRIQLSSKRWAVREHDTLVFNNVYANNLWCGAGNVFYVYQYYKQYRDVGYKQDALKYLEELKYDVDKLNDDIITVLYDMLVEELQAA